MNRRHWFVAGAAAAAAGVGWQLWRERQSQDQAERGLASLWPLRFPRPEGGEAQAMRAVCAAVESLLA